MIGDREKSLVVGTPDHLIKPIDSECLFNVLSKWIDPRQTHPSSAEPEQALITLDMRTSVDLPFDFALARQNVVNDLTLALRITHTLKGAAATNGAQQLHLSALRLELAYKQRVANENPDIDCSELLLALETTLQQLLANLVALSLQPMP